NAKRSSSSFQDSRQRILRPPPPVAATLRPPGRGKAGLSSGVCHRCTAQTPRVKHQVIEPRERRRVAHDLAPPRRAADTSCQSGRRSRSGDSSRRSFYRLGASQILSPTLGHANRNSSRENPIGKETECTHVFNINLAEYPFSNPAAV